MPLSYLPKDLADDVSNWSFAGTVNDAMQGLKSAGTQLMQPVEQQVASVVESSRQALPAMPSTESMVGGPRGPAPEPSPALKGFSLGTVEDWLGPQEVPKASPESATPQGMDQNGRFSLPSAESFFAQIPSAVGRAAGAATGAVSSAVTTARGGVAPGVPSDPQAYLRSAAATRGIDPEQVAKVMMKEGPGGWGAVGRFETGTSYGPLQLHYAGGTNPKAGMGDAFTKATGIDLRTDTSVAAHQRAVDYALDQLAATGDYREWYGADPALGSRFTKVNRVAPVQTAAPAEQPAAAGAGAPRWGTYTAETLTPNQYTEGQAQGLSTAEALAVCGPAAAVAFARANGRNPSLREAKELAQSAGVWSAGTGMYGPESEVKLLAQMGVQARLQQGADWSTIAQEVEAGRPVIVDTPGHYYTVTGYDPQSGQFEFGQSAGVLKASKGRTRYRPEEIPGLGMGAPRATIFMGAPR